jgi:hypothetical protein
MSDNNTPWWEDEQELEKLAASGVSLDKIEALIKEAARQKELEEIYADFDAAGRIMAHSYWDEMNKLAASAAEAKKMTTPEEAEEEAQEKKVLVSPDNKAKEAKLAALQRLIKK